MTDSDPSNTQIPVLPLMLIPAQTWTLVGCLALHFTHTYCEHTVTKFNINIPRLWTTGSYSTFATAEASVCL